MTEQRFLSELSTLLRKLPEAERKDILSDYEEHIRVALGNGQTEDEAVRALGTPKAIAKEMLADFHIHRAEVERTVWNVFRALLAVTGLGFINLVFALGPAMAACGILACFFGGSISMSVAPIVGIIATLSGSTLTFTNFSDPLTSIFTLLIVEGVGILWLCGSVLLVRALVKIFVSYLKFNFRLIKGGNSSVA